MNPAVTGGFSSQRGNKAQYFHLMTLTWYMFVANSEYATKNYIQKNQTILCILLFKWFQAPQTLNWLNTSISCGSFYIHAYIVVFFTPSLCHICLQLAGSIVSKTSSQQFYHIMFYVWFIFVWLCIYMFFKSIYLLCDRTQWQNISTEWYCWCFKLSSNTSFSHSKLSVWLRR